MPFKVQELKPLIDAQPKPIVFYSYTLPSPFARTGLAEAGVVILTGLTHVGVALRQLVRHARFRLASDAARDAAPGAPVPAIEAAAWSEYDSKRLLRDAGIAVPDELLVDDRTKLPAAVAQAGFPLVMKIQSPDIPHKSEVGGVRVGMASDADAQAAFDDLIAAARRHRPDAAIQGVLVGPMANKGVELIVGTMCDATFGPMVMVGLGGVATELYRDVVYRPAPVGAAEARAMLQSLKAWPLLDGFRGAAKADVPAAAGVIAQLSQLAAHWREAVAEIEVNPVLVHPEGQGVTIVDALVVPARKEAVSAP